MSNADTRWVAYLATAEPTLFQHPDWASLMEEIYGFPARVAMLLRDGSVAGGLPYSEVEDFRGRRRVVGAFADVCEPLGDGVWPQIERALCNEGIPWQMRSRTEPGPEALETRRVAVHQLIQLPADAAEARMFSRCKQPPQARRALRAGVVVRRFDGVEAIDVFYPLHTQTRKEKHRLLPQPRALFDGLARRFFPERGFVLAAELNGAVIAAVLLLMCGDVLYYKFGASDQANLACRPNDLLLWSTIETAAQMGLRYVDWGISEAESLIQFKRKYASHEQPVFATHYLRAAKCEHILAMENSLAQMTRAFTQAEVPPAAAQAAASALYRYFV